MLVEWLPMLLSCLCVQGRLPVTARTMGECLTGGIDLRGALVSFDLRRSAAATVVAHSLSTLCVVVV